MRRLRILVLLTALLAPLPGLAAEPARVGVRAGDHPGFGRLVFDVAPGTDFRVAQEGVRLTIIFTTQAQFDLPARRPRNLAEISAGETAVTLRLAEGAVPRTYRLGNRVVLDIADPPTATPPPRQAEPPRRAAPAAAQPPGTAPPAQPPAPAMAIPTPPAAPPPPAIVTSPLPAPGGVGLRVQADGALLVPAGTEVGAALFRRGDLWLFVVDHPLPLDLAALSQHPRFAGAHASAGPDATTLRLPAAAFALPTVRRTPQGWLIEAPHPPPPGRSLVPEIQAGPPIRLAVAAPDIGRSLPILDPETGGLLLVGTLRGGGAVPLGRRSATLDILPTRLGLAFLPRADTLRLSALPDRFVLDAAPGTALALGDAPGAALVAAADLTRQFDLPAEGLAAAQERLRNAHAAIAAAAPMARGQPRLRAAEALLAIGLPQEAQAMAVLALREDPRLNEQPRARALAAAAALAGGRVSEARDLDAPGLPDTDEAGLWQALRAIAEERPADLARLRAGLPLLLSYPEPLQARLLPAALEALVDAGDLPLVARVLDGAPTTLRGLDMARARLAEAQGRHDSALAAYAALAAGRDRLARARAIRRAAELRLALGQADAATTAAAVETTLAAWRGDGRESEARLRVAALRGQAGDPRGAFDLLRETETLFPDLAPSLRPLQAEALLGALEREAPLVAVTLFDAHASLLPAGAAAETAARNLAERLAALDLADRAQAVLRRALADAAGDHSRAEIGARLAALALNAGDAARAAAYLAETDGRPADGPLAEALATERTLLAARAAQRQGQSAAARAGFRAAGPAGLPELAELLAEAQEWPAAAAALAAQRAARPPAEPEALHRLILREAALRALANDEAGLATMRQAHGAAMAGGRLSEAFGLITGARAASTDDLPRLRAELEVARAAPAGLEVLRGSAPVAR
jgi:hypothetical protein